MNITKEVLAMASVRPGDIITVPEARNYLFIFYKNKLRYLYSQPLKPTMESFMAKGLDDSSRKFIMKPQCRDCNITKHAMYMILQGRFTNHGSLGSAAAL